MDPESMAMVKRPGGDGMSWTQLKELAKYAVASKRFPLIRNPEQALMQIQYGRELNLGPATALQAIYMVVSKDGKQTLALKANTIASRIKTVPWRGTEKNRYDYRIVERTDKRCELEFFERGDDGFMEPRGRVDYTLADAKRTGDSDRNPNYAKRPKNMLFARCLTEGARIFCPDCLGGIAPYTPDELGATTDEDGTPIEDADFTVKESADETTAPDFDEAEKAITEEEYQFLSAAANQKNLSLPDVIHGLGGDASDCRSISRAVYEAAKTFIERK